MGGLKRTAAQQKARAANGLHGGRPRRVCLFCGQPTVAGHVDRALDVSCGAHGWRWKKPSDPDGLSREALERDIAFHTQALVDLQKALRKAPRP